MPKRILSALTASALAASLFTGCSSPKYEIELYDGNYSEIQLVHKMVELLVEDRTDIEVTIKDQMSSVLMFRELTREDPSCDIFCSYDGSVLTTHLKQGPPDVPEGVTLFDYVSEQVYDKHGVIMLDPLGINNTYCIAVPESVAEEYNLETISDLVPVAGELTFGAEHEFFAAEGTAGTMKFGPFTEFYGLNFKETFPVDISLKYTAIENGNFQVTEVYTTDGLNRKANLKVLEDDRNFFPEYNGSLLVREELFEEMADVAPDLREILSLLSGTMDNEKMTDMTYAVDVEGRTVDEVAREFLVENGLLDA
ncbi:MAG: glycine betaine ABC transporter substrate-binding protein [Acutalibacteraceae bacterium]